MLKNGHTGTSCTPEKAPFVPINVEKTNFNFGMILALWLEADIIWQRNT